jgi:pimeloyl-ACP methyl ester carboxylesterase
MRPLTSPPRSGSMLSTSARIHSAHGWPRVLPTISRAGSAEPCLPARLWPRAPRCRSAPNFEARARVIERGGYGFGARTAALLGSAASSATAALVQQTLRATNPAEFMQAARSTASEDSPPLGTRLSMPLVMIQGEEDRDDTGRGRPGRPGRGQRRPACGGAAAGAIVRLPGCGHLPEIEFPECANALIREHLSGPQ